MSDNKKNGQVVRKTPDLGVIKDYKILSVIGEGGMGKVYRAFHPTLKREIILKELKIRDKETRERFLREAKVMLDFRHENIVQFYDHFKEGTSTYIAMEYVKGLALNELIIQSEKIPVSLALFILYQAALGLNHAHTKKVIHRDIKPHNLLISETGDVKLIDFGIASQKSEGSDSLTAPGTVIGTPAYMSPEQFSSSKEITYQSDIYSLGVVFYEMITGVRPFKNEYSSEVIESIAKGKYPPVQKYVKKIPAVAKKILKKTFNPVAKKRFKTLVPLIKMLKNYFRKYNQYELKASIRLLLKNEKDMSKYPFYTRYAELNKRMEHSVISLFTFTVLVAVGVCFFYNNKHYEWVLRNQYGKVKLHFNKANLDPGSTFIRVDDRYIKAGLKSGQEEYEKIFYLRKGYHEISIMSGSYKITRKIDLLPISGQIKTPVTKNGMNVNIKVYNLVPKEVMLNLRFWDALDPDKYLFQFDYYSGVTDKLLEEEGNLSIWDSSRNCNTTLRDYVVRKIKLNHAPFYSNTDYAFLVSGFEKDGVKYDNRRFKLKFGLDERTVVAHIPLAPVPARIKIVSPFKRGDLFINSSDAGLVFKDDAYKAVKYNSIKGKPFGKGKYCYEYLVPPSKMKLSIGKKGRVIEKVIDSDGVIELNIKKENGKIVY